MKVKLICADKRYSLTPGREYKILDKTIDTARRVVYYLIKNDEGYELWYSQKVVEPVSTWDKLIAFKDDLFSLIVSVFYWRRRP